MKIPSASIEILRNSEAVLDKLRGGFLFSVPSEYAEFAARIEKLNSPQLDNKTILGRVLLFNAVP